jgi:hypothetical protein
MNILKNLSGVVASSVCVFVCMACSGNRVTIHQPVDGLAVCDSKGNVIFNKKDIIGVRITNGGHGNVLWFQLTEPAVMRYFKLKDGVNLAVTLNHQRLPSFNVSHGIGTGVGGYTFSIDDIMLSSGARLSSVILKR